MPERLGGAHCAHCQFDRAQGHYILTTFQHIILFKEKRDYSANEIYSRIKEVSETYVIEKLADLCVRFHSECSFSAIPKLKCQANLILQSRNATFLEFLSSIVCVFEKEIEATQEKVAQEVINLFSLFENVHTSRHTTT